MSVWSSSDKLITTLRIRSLIGVSFLLVFAISKISDSLISHSEKVVTV